jgi:hypothetical protein
MEQLLLAAVVAEAMPQLLVEHIKNFQGQIITFGL